MDRQHEKFILLVDDNLTDLRSLKQLLDHLGYPVVSTDDPHDALTIFRARPGNFDLIITDQFLPGMKGHELAAHLHAIRKDIPVILCSGCEETLLELQEQGSDINEFMLKPFSKSELVDAIQRVRRRDSLLSFVDAL